MPADETGDDVGAPPLIPPVARQCRESLEMPGVCWVHGCDLIDCADQP